MDFRGNAPGVGDEETGRSGDKPLGTGPEVVPGEGKDEVTECLSFLARRFERPSSHIVIRAGLALNEKGQLPFHQAESALDLIGLRGTSFKGKLERLTGQRLPA